MKICILATNENVEAVRATARTLLPNLPEVLQIPLSPSGQNPPTHWFCNFKVSQEMYATLLAAQNLSEMEESNADKFLDKKGLKVIRRR